MEELEGVSQVVMIELRCFAESASDAAKTLESLQRVMLGLALDGVAVFVTASLMEAEECEHHDHTE